MLAQLVLFLSFVVGPVVRQLEQVEVVFVSVFLHLVMEHFVGHEHIAPKLSGGALVAFGHVKDFLRCGLKVGAPDASGVNGHGHLDHNFVFVDTGTGLPSVFTQVGQERQTKVLDGKARHGVSGG